MADAGTNEGPQLDLSDVDHRLGQLVGGGQLYEPCAKSDIRRWVMAMDYANPLHWDQEFARGTKFGDIVAPQSHRRCARLWPRLPARLCRPYPGQPPDLRRRGMVVVWHAGAPRRQAVPGAALL